MQKAKLMLSAVAIVAVIGTAFAFKAKTFTNHFIYTGTVNGGVCTFKLEGAALTNPAPNDIVVAASTASLGSGCPNKFTIEITD